MLIGEGQRSEHLRIVVFGHHLLEQFHRAAIVTHIHVQHRQLDGGVGGIRLQGKGFLQCFLGVGGLIDGAIELRGAIGRLAPLLEGGAELSEGQAEDGGHGA